MMMMMIRAAVVVVASALAVLCLAVALPAQARDLVWVGRSMGFAEEYNWNNGAPLNVRSSPVSYVDSRSDTPFAAHVPEEIYNVGHTWMLPRNGVFKFERDADVVIKLTDAAALQEGTGAAPTTFLGPRDDLRFDFNCPRNWNLFNGTVAGSIPQIDAPTADDRVLFPAGTTYSVFSAQRLTNVEAVHFGSDFASMPPVTDCAALPEHQFAQIDCERFEIGTTTLCTGDLQLDGECLTFNTCPTEEQQVDQDQRIVDAAREDAMRRAQVLSSSVLRPLDFTFALRAIAGGDMAYLSLIESAVNDPDTLARIVSGIDSSINDMDGYTLSSLAAAVGMDATVTLTGTIVSSVKNLLKRNEPLDATSEVTYPSPFAVASTFDVALIAAFRAVLQDEVSAAVLGEHAAALEECVAADPQCNLFDSADRILRGATNISAADLVAAVCPANACPGSLSETRTAIEMFLADTPIMYADSEDPASLAESLASLLAGATVSDDVTDFLANDDLQDAVSTVLNVGSPTVASFTLRLLVFGSRFPRLSQLLLLNSDNYDAFLDALTEALLDRLPWRAVTWSEVTVSLGSDRRRRRRRRRATSPLPGEQALILSLSYNVTCYTDLCEAFNVTDAVRAQVAEIAESVAATFTTEPNPCFVALSGAIQDTPSEECISDLTNDFLSDECDVQCATDAVVYELECGAAGRNQLTGTCLTEASPDLEAMIGIFVSNEAASRAASQNAAVPIPIIAGAIGGVVLLAIVALVVVRRKGSGSRGKPGSGSGQAVDRDVLAFENPVYNDHNQQHSDALYADALNDTGEGLYSEPSFTQGSKDNPLYHSLENLQKQSTTEPEQEGDYDEFDTFEEVDHEPDYMDVSS